MGLWAIRGAGDAIDLTREFLVDQSLRRYVLLSVMAAFLGPTGVAGPPGPVELRREMIGLDDGGFDDVVAGIPTELVLGVLVGLAIVALVALLVGAFLEFAFVHSLVTERVAITAPVRSHWRRALALFGFRAVVGTLILGSTAGVLLLLVPAAWRPVTVDPVGTLAVSLVVGVSGYLATRLTTDFAVPIMYAERRGLISSWGRVLGLLRRHPREYLVYVPVRILLEIAIGIGFAVILGLGVLALALVVGLPVGVVVLLLLGSTAAIVAVLLILVPLAIALVALLLVPFHTYLRYFTLLVLDGTDPTLDLVSEMRRRVEARTQLSG